MSIRKRTWKSAGEIKTAWVVDYVDQHGDRRLKTFDLKKDADAWATKARYEVATGAHACGRATVGEALDQWIAHCIDEGLERSTTEQRKRHIRLHIAPFIGHIKLSALTAPRVNAFANELRDAGRSPAMRRKALTSLSTALAFAKGRGMVAHNPAHGIKVRSDARSKGGPLKVPSKADLKLLIDNAPERWRTFIIVAIFTGLRASELRGLRWADVDLNNATLRVSQRADQWGKIGSPKSRAGRREVPLTPLVVNALKQHKLASANSDLVFTSTTGSIVSHSNFSADVWRPLLKRCGLRFEFHSLRHAAASLFIELGWQPKRIQALMGHS
jgi:integrase